MSAEYMWVRLWVYAYRLEMSLVLSMEDTDSIMNSMRITVFITAAIADVVAFVPVYLTLGVFGSLFYIFFVFLALRAIKKFSAVEFDSRINHVVFISPSVFCWRKMYKRWSRSK